MAEFTSSLGGFDATPNVLFDPIYAKAAAQKYQSNALAMQQTQQQIGEGEADMMGRAAQGLLSLPDEASRAAAYPGAVADLQRLGFAKNAPSQYPGEATLRRVAAMGLSQAQQYQYGVITAPGLQGQIDAILGKGGSGSGTDPVSGLPVEQALPALERRESGGRNIPTELKNPDGTPASTASGYYQMLDNTFQEGMRLAGIPGTWTRAMDAPREVQTAAANAIYQKYGVAPWAASNPNRGSQTAATGQPGAPPAAPASPPGVQMGGEPPAPPGGSGGSYAGGGIGAQLSNVAPHPGGPQFTVAPPPVIKAAPIPASRTGQRVAEDVGAITAGMEGARTGPAPPTALTAGPGAPTQTAMAPPASQPGFGASVGTYSDSPNVAASPNRLAPPAPQTPATPAAAPAFQMPPTGVNSPQYQQAMDLQRKAMALEALVDPTGRAQRLAQGLRQQAQLLLQTDSVVQLPDGRQLHPLTGKIDDPAKPLADYHETSPGSGIWVGGLGTEPRFQPPGRLVVDPAGNVWQTSVGGAHMLAPTDPSAIAARKAAEAQGTATGTAVAKQVPALIDQGRTASQAIGNIDYGMSQIQKAKEGGITTGYFAPWVATLGAIGKSIGGDVGERIATFGADPAAVGNIQTAAKTLAVVSGAILEQILGPGSQITDAKIQHFIHAQPGIETDPEALSRVLNWARSQFVYEQEMSKAGVTEAAKSPTGTLPLNWQATYFRDHGFAPIYNPGTGEMQQPDGQSPGREPPVNAPTAPVNPSARTAGTTYQTPKGPLKWTGTGWVSP